LPNALYNVFEKHKNILAYFSQESQQCTRLYITNITHPISHWNNQAIVPINS